MRVQRLGVCLFSAFTFSLEDEHVLQSGDVESGPGIGTEIRLREQRGEGGSRSRCRRGSRRPGLELVTGSCLFVGLGNAS